MRRDSVDPRPHRRRHLATMLAAVLAALLGTVTVWPALAGPAQAADARAFSCSGNAGEAFTAHTVTGLLTGAHVPYQVVVKGSGGAVESSRRAKGVSLGASPLHTGFTQWDVSGPNPDGNLQYLHLPPVLPGAGGFFDALLEIEYAGGANGSLQIPMTDCTVTGGPPALSTPPGPRSFTCTGSLGEVFTIRTVAGQLTRQNQPLAVAVTNSAGTAESTRARKATSMGASPLHTGYTQWDVTGPNPDGNLYYLHLPPVLPAVGGYADADLEITFGNGGGSWQIPMTDCTIA